MSKPAEAMMAQRLTNSDFNAVFPSSIGCIDPRCFSSVPAVDGDTAITTNVGTGVMVRSAPGLWDIQQVRQTLWATLAICIAVLSWRAFLSTLLTNPRML